MSTPSDNAAHESYSAAGRKPSRGPEKSSFAQTCNLLSQYLKEKRSLGITPRIEPKDEFPTARPPAIMNFLTTMDNPEEYSKEKASALANSQPMGFLPQPMGYGSPAEGLAKTEPPSAAQMTIFYGGKVLVFNDLPSDRAEEIMAMASKGIGSFRSAATVSDKVTEPATGNGSATTKEQIHQQPQTKVPGDLPIARRASLHRFFEKRKDRVAARAPYQVNPQQHSASSKPAGESYRFNNGDEKGNQQSSNHFDLNL